MFEELKTSILNRIKRAIDDETKTISPENLKTLTHIVLCLTEKEKPLESKIMELVKTEEGGGI